MSLAVGSAARAAPDQRRCGDACVVAARDGGSLVAVVDGLGHGEEAADAAEAAVSVLQDNASLSLPELVSRCHEALRRTRGAVLSLVLVDDPGERLEWIGIGNVEGMVLRQSSRDSLLVRGGVVGYKLPPLKPSSTAFGVGDTLLLHTDGFDAGFAHEVEEGPLDEVAARLLRDHARGDDDALVLLLRRGGGA